MDVGGEMFADYIFDKGFSTASYKELLQLEPKYYIVNPT